MHVGRTNIVKNENSPQKQCLPPDGASQVSVDGGAATWWEPMHKKNRKKGSDLDSPLLMWPLYPGLENHYKLVFTLFMIGCLISVIPNGLDHWLSGQCRCCLFLAGKKWIFRNFTSKGECHHA